MAKQDLDANNAAVDDFFETADVETLASSRASSLWILLRARELGSFGRRTRA